MLLLTSAVTRLITYTTEGKNAHAEPLRGRHTRAGTERELEACSRSHNVAQPIPQPGETHSTGLSLPRATGTQVTDSWNEDLLGKTMSALAWSRVSEPLEVKLLPSPPLVSLHPPLLSAMLQPQALSAKFPTGNFSTGQRHDMAERAV